MRRGQSDVIGALILTAAAVTLAAFILGWGAGLASLSQRGYSEELAKEGLRAGEAPVIADVAFDVSLVEEGWSGRGLILFLSNAGSSETVVDRVYVNGGAAESKPSSVVVQPKEIAKMLVRFEWEANQTYLVRVASSSGVFGEGYFAAKGAAVIPEFPGGAGLALTLSFALLLLLAFGRGGVRGRRGVSYILSVVIMALVITSLAGAVMYWGLGMISSSQGEYQAAISADLDRVRERFVVEHVVFKPSLSKVTVYVRNVGMVPVTIDALYFNGTRIAVDPPLRLGLGVSGSVTVSTPAYSRGDVVTVFVSSQRGNVVGGYWRVK